MVQYSIEAGLIGPGVRVFLGGLLATGADRGRRVDAALRVHAADRQRPDRQHAGHAHRRRHHRRIRHRVCGLRALRLPRGCVGVRVARYRGARDARRRAAARAVARGARTARRVRRAHARLDRTAELLGALHLPRRRDRRLVCAGARTAVALARDHRGGLCGALGICRSSGPSLQPRTGRALSRGRLRPRRVGARLRSALRAGRRERPHRSGVLRRAFSLPGRRRRAGARARP
jgi:hypothetical protein